MPVIERTHGRSKISYREIRAVLDRQFRTYMDSEFGIDTSDWDLARIGTQYWIVNGRGKPVILLANSDSRIALGAIKGISHGLHLEDTLIETGVLHPNWEDFE